MKTTGKSFLFIGLLIGGLFLAWTPDASGVPMWARRYGVPCAYCHAFPSLQLTGPGLDFFRRGHRIGNDSFDKDLTHLLSAGVVWEYQIEQGQQAKFESPTFHVHAGGALSGVFSVYVDATINETLEVAYLQATKEWGSSSYVTARAGKITPTIIRNYGNGIMASASTPLILTDTTLGSNPFTPARDSFGVNAAGAWKSFFFETGVVNGEDVEDQAAVKNHKDFYATGEWMLLDGVSGVGLYYYRGGYDLGDPAEGLLFDRYERKGVFANFTRDAFRLAGAYVYGNDRIETRSNRKIWGYYVQADYHPVGWLTPFARYEEVKTETDEEAGRTRRGTLGSAIRLYDNESNGGKVVVEGFRKKEASKSANGALISLLWAF